MTSIYSDQILNTLEAHLESSTGLETGTNLLFHEHTSGENSTVRFMRIKIHDDTYLVMAKRIGGPS